MLVSEAIERMKVATHDAIDEYSEAHCIDFLNHAIQQVSAYLIAAKYPPLVQEIVVTDGQELPLNYTQAAGTYPLKMTAGKAYITDDSESVKFRYFATPEKLTEVTEELPFSHTALEELIVDAAVMLALNENEFDITQDSSIWKSLQEAVAGVI